ncbi:hypothetical protein BJ878DRAFT_483543 [Calycina marina]|uniref:Uncharacterized protein n=1 Tax=Calycina marina TaxID=1763456 RepID=A0A9P8CCZ7_9HELO|nr:hypothetical protein BJ878DRAFT_483543 [Calycina marina]
MAGSYIKVPVRSVAAAILLLIHIPDNRAHKTSTTTVATNAKLDLSGFAIFAPCVTMLLLAIEWDGAKFLWNSATVIAPFCGASVMFNIFAFWEKRVADKAMTPSGYEVMLGTVVPGALLEKFGYCLSWMITSVVLDSIDFGPYSTLKVNSLTAQWVEFQILGGLGEDFGL